MSIVKMKMVCVFETQILSFLNSSHAGWTPLISASSGGHVGIVRLLLENQSDASAVTDQDKSALFYAAR